MAEKNGVYKIAFTHVVTVLVTGAIAWFSFGGGIERSEARKIADHAAADAINSTSFHKKVSGIVATESPYVKDKSGIDERLKNIEAGINRILRKIDQ